MGKERNVPWEEILRRRKEGETARALAEEFGVSVESVYKRGQRERRAQRGSLQQAARNLCRSAGSMVAQMDKEGFGSCTFTGACEAVCPKEISITNISRMHKEFLMAGLSSEK